MGHVSSTQTHTPKFTKSIRQWLLTPWAQGGLSRPYHDGSSDDRKGCGFCGGPRRHVRTAHSRHTRHSSQLHASWYVDDLQGALLSPCPMLRCFQRCWRYQRCWGQMPPDAPLLPTICHVYIGISIDKNTQETHCAHSSCNASSWTRLGRSALLTEKRWWQVVNIHFVCSYTK